MLVSWLWNLDLLRCIGFRRFICSLVAQLCIPRKSPPAPRIHPKENDIGSKCNVLCLSRAEIIGCCDHWDQKSDSCFDTLVRWRIYWFGMILWEMWGKRNRKIKNGYDQTAMLAHFPFQKFISGWPLFVPFNLHVFLKHLRGSSSSIYSPPFWNISPFWNIWRAVRLVSVKWSQNLIILFCRFRAGWVS